MRVIPLANRPVLPRELSDPELLQEWHYWDAKLRHAARWGASVGAANEFRKECQSEINRRNEETE